MNSWLEQKCNFEIDREPYFCTFSYNNKEFTVVNFLAITKSMQPETEVKYFKYFPENYEGLKLIFVGDFNCPQSHKVFNPWRKINYFPAFKNQKTSLKKSCKGKNCLASEFDNIWFNSSTILLLESKAIHFYNDFKNLDLANDVSDHFPISISFILK